MNRQKKLNRIENSKSDTLMHDVLVCNKGPSETYRLTLDFLNTWYVDIWFAIWKI